MAIYGSLVMPVAVALQPNEFFVGSRRRPMGWPGHRLATLLRQLLPLFINPTKKNPAAPRPGLKRSRKWRLKRCEKYLSPG